MIWGKYIKSDPVYKQNCGSVTCVSQCCVYCSENKKGILTGGNLLISEGCAVMAVTKLPENLSEFSED